MSPLEPSFGIGDVEILRRHTVYRGFGKVHWYSVHHRLHGGGFSDEIRREVYEASDAVVVLPYDPRRDEVVLVEQFRAPPLVNGRRPWLIECVAGRIDRPGTPEEIARTEAREEAGCTLSELEFIARLYASPGVFTEAVYCYCGRTDTSGLGGVHGMGEENEDIKVHVVSFAEAMRALGDGRVDSATAFAVLQWLALNRERLRRAWR